MHTQTKDRRESKKERKNYSKTEESEIRDKREQNKSNVVVVVAAVNYTRNRESVPCYWFLEKKKKEKKSKGKNKMSVAVSNSPVFSPSSSLFCNKTSIITASPEALSLTLSHLKPSPCSSSSSAPSSPSSPFRLRFPKPPTGLSSSSSSVSVSTSGSSSPNTVLKRKRPARLDIPVASMCFGAPTTPSMAAREVVEEEANGYSVYCKRGRREAMEDRYSALLNLQGDSKQVLSLKFTSFSFLVLGLKIRCAL